MLKITQRPATIQDMLNAHEDELKPWEDWRRTAKTENFALLFGCAPGRFGQTLRDRGFKVKDCEDLIEDAGLTDMYNEAIAKAKEKNVGGDIDLVTIKYTVCAQFMRDGFFQGYKGLEDRIQREWSYADRHGYVRAWHGPFRHLPELLLVKTNANGNLVGADKELWSKYVSELKNIACNTTIQTMEVRIAFCAIHYLCQTVKKWHLKSYMFSMCHDSQDWVIYDKEQDLVLALIKYAAEFYREPVKGIPMCMDFQVADLSTPELREKYYYHYGKIMEGGDIHEELEKYNKANGTNLEFIPIQL